MFSLGGNKKKENPEATAQPSNSKPKLPKPNRRGSSISSAASGTALIGDKDNATNNAAGGGASSTEAHRGSQDTAAPTVSSQMIPQQQSLDDFRFPDGQDITNNPQALLQAPSSASTSKDKSAHSNNKKDKKGVAPASGQSSAKTKGSRSKKVRALPRKVVHRLRGYGSRLRKKLHRGRKHIKKPTGPTLKLRVQVQEPLGQAAEVGEMVGAPPPPVPLPGA
ncbi:hypothetical protein B0T26DRAFT_749348 [Lasiosphaeria miniovina]|uniref:Uncharacterized protein n=1 Tax=Lasiosphaeria miniovina TaxID=1954250 RepID=A0AA40E450_9PEZI|nr:uncharacterized protein B0T26DRAFT_749348 [Lasiosphaeria miniovina]KAK0721878.1 hypothetical protein B0T26DRAFT_749348 [Lasiosphaeria miniovina]